MTKKSKPTIQDDIDYIDECIENLKKTEYCDLAERYRTIAQLLESKALLISIQMDQEMSLEDL